MTGGEGSYPICGVCGKGRLIPVAMLETQEGRLVRYRCTNPECNVRFDQHGYERYDPEKQDWVRL